MGFWTPGGALFDNVQDMPSGNWAMQSKSATMPAASAAIRTAPTRASSSASTRATTSPHPNGVENVWQGVSSPASYVPDLVGTPAQLQTLRGVIVGLQFQAPASRFDLFIDDIAVDTSYIPCDQ